MLGQNLVPHVAVPLLDQGVVLIRGFFFATFPGPEFDVFSTDEVPKPTIGGFEVFGPGSAIFLIRRR